VSIEKKTPSRRETWGVSKNTSLARLFLGELLLSSAASASPGRRIVAGSEEQSKP